MKNRNLYILSALFLGACAAPTSSIELASNQIDKTGYLFYQNSDINLHISELKNKLVLPAEEYSVPDYINLLPNAKRDYRSGYHMGVDFSSPMNYPIRAAFDGVVVRSNAYQQDVDIDTYNYFLSLSSQVGKTPDDIYNFILLGKSVVIDHGYNITDKYRAITVYSHLSSITEGMMAGDVVQAGDIIGLSGNTGTSSGALQNDKGAHLHWELFFDDKSGRYFLGQNIPSDLLKINIEQLFQ
jgi:murein DD-endopeptidase MepM/ murein hydrolase activator NlpD|tara:strand:+ start:559 stop:1281 length:723 start_codon:yes stop_codon:yes gene_type:complete